MSRNINTKAVAIDQRDELVALLRESNDILKHFTHLAAPLRQVTARNDAALARLEK